MQRKGGSSMTERRDFLRQSFLIGAALALAPGQLFAGAKREKLIILHTNDWHSRIEPFPMDGGRNQGLGGAAKRAALIRKIREEEKHVLLLDSGDIFQGTPYFNQFGGELEYRLMSEMGYDAATLGNHDFDNGLKGLKDQLPHATFPLVCANYDFSGTELAGLIESYKIVEKGSWKIGILGIGIELKGLVPEKLYGATVYQDPVDSANKVAKQLKEEDKCDLVICLSHLGYKYSGSKVSDQVLAKDSEHIDLILGGHTHTFLNKPEGIVNKKGHVVIVNQSGWGGIVLGRLDIEWTLGGKLSNPHNTMLKVS